MQIMKTASALALMVLVLMPGCGSEKPPPSQPTTAYFSAFAVIVSQHGAAFQEPPTSSPQEIAAGMMVNTFQQRSTANGLMSLPALDVYPEATAIVRGYAQLLMTCATLTDQAAGVIKDPAITPEQRREQQETFKQVAARVKEAQAVFLVVVEKNTEALNTNYDYSYPGLDDIAELVRADIAKPIMPEPQGFDWTKYKVPPREQWEKTQ